MNAHRVPCVLPVLLVCGALAGPASGYLEHPASWKQESEDGRYVLVMVSPLPVDEDAGDGGVDEAAIREIRAKYTQSGLYPNDGSTTPLWTVPYWGGSKHRAQLAPDAKHLIVAAYDWYQSYGHVVTFYAAGRELASYRESDLFSLLPVRGAARMWPERESCEFAPGEMTYTIRATTGEEIIFDVTTGDVVSTRSSWPARIGILLGASVLLPCLAVGLIVLLTRKHRVA